MNALEAAALAVIDRLEEARARRAPEHELVAVLLASGWRPMLADEADAEVREGLLAGGARVPVVIRHATARR